MTLPPPVTEILYTLLASLQDSLGENLVGLYLRGSLALGDFIPETSDLDILAITETLVTETEYRSRKSDTHLLRRPTTGPVQWKTVWIGKG